MIVRVFFREIVVGAMTYVSDNVKLILEMTSALITNTSSPRDYSHQDDHTAIAVVLDERTRRPSLVVVFPD